MHPVRADAITRFLIRGMVVFAPSRRAISLALIPAVVLGVAVARNAVNVPVADQWELVRLFSALQEGHLSWRDVFAVHNEHRYAIPNLYFLGLGTLTKWDVRWEMWTTFLLACSTVLFLLALLQTSEVPEAARPALAFLISLTVLNPALVENWLWGYQAAMLVPPLCLSAGIVIACRPIRPSVQLAASAALAFIASFSFGNGLLVWILIVAIICCSPTWPSFSHKRTAILFWCVALLACLTLYFWGFPTTSNLEPFRQRASFGTTLEYWFGLLGAPLAAGVLVTPRRADIVCGALLLALFASGAVVTWRSGSRVMRGWVVFGSVSVITAAMVTGGRVGIDDANVAFTSRYLLFAGPMVIATGVLWTEYLSGLGGAHPSRAGNALVTTFVVLQVLAAAAGVERMAVLRENRLQGKALLAFIDHVEEPGLATKVYPWSGLRNHARALQELDYLRPPLVQVPWRPQNSPADSRSGRFERLTVGSSSLEAEGWAIRQERNEPADAVVLAVETAAGCCTVVAVADERERAPTLIRLGRRALANAGWRKSIAFDRLPADAVSMRAWAYDAMTGQSFELSGRHKIDR